MITSRKAKSTVAVHVPAVDIRGNGEICRVSEWRVGVPVALQEIVVGEAESHLHRHISGTANASAPGMAGQELERLVADLASVPVAVHPNERYTKYSGFTPALRFLTDSDNE